MNKDQRKKIQSLVDELYIIQEEEQEKYDNSPEGLQDTERTDKFQENADQLQESIDILESLLEE